MRVLVIGTSGSGKSSFARRLAAAYGGDYIELDAFHWSGNWTERPRPEFLRLVRASIASDRWVADGNYAIARDILWPRATHVVWLNYSRWVVFSRVFRRTLRRGLRCEPLWHGNRESLWRSFFSTDSILLWSLNSYSGNRAKYRELRASGAYPHLLWSEFGHPSEAECFLSRWDGAARAAAGGGVENE